MKYSMSTGRLLHRCIVWRAAYCRLRTTAHRQQQHRLQQASSRCTDSHCIPTIAGWIAAQCRLCVAAHRQQQQRLQQPDAREPRTARQRLAASPAAAGSTGAVNTRVSHWMRMGTVFAPTLLRSTAAVLPLCPLSHAANTTEPAPGTEGAPAGSCSASLASTSRLAARRC